MILLTDDYRKRKTAHAVPGSFFDNEQRGWFFDPDGNDRAAQIAMRLFPHVRSEIPSEQLQRIELGQSLGRFDAASEYAAGRSPADLLPDVPEALRSKLYPYQVTDLGFITARIAVDGAGYLAWDRGLGKTLGAITLAYQLNAKRILVVTPSMSKAATWRPEFDKWDIEARWKGNIYDVGNTRSSRETAVRNWSKPTGGVLLCHYEALRLIESFGLRPDLVIVDEAHRLANGSSRAKAPAFYKALKRVKCPAKLLLSGSVLINSPEDFFGALHYMYPHVYKSQWRDWNDKYLSFVDGGFGRVLVGVVPARLPEMREELARVMCVRDKQDELPGLPRRVDRSVELEMYPEQRRVYHDLAESFLASLPDSDDPIVVSTQMGQLVKLRQVAVGLDLLDSGVRCSAKLDYAEQLIVDTLPRKTVVFAWHRAAVDALVARLEAKGVTAVGVHGGVPQKDRDVRVSSFQHDPDPKVLVATIKTLGESVNLQVASDVIFVESSWTDADMQQAADRVYRIGQEHRVTVTNIYSTDTVDLTHVLPTVTTKADLRRMILGG